MIKKNIFLLILVLNSITVFCQQSLFVDKKYDEILSQSKTENKPIVIMFYATWCPHCNLMKKEVFTDSSVIDFYSKNFICMAVDAPSVYGQELRAKFENKFKVTSFPTFAFLDSNENLLYCISGEFKKDKFISEGNDVLLPENQLPNIKNTYIADVSNPDKCLKYITTIRKAGIDPTPIAQKYLSNISSEDKKIDINWRVFSNGISNFDTDEFKFVVQNKEQFSKAISPSRVEKKIVYTISETLKALVDKKDTLNYDKKRIVAESFHIHKVDSLLFRLDIQMASQKTNWKKYQKITSQNIEKYSWNGPVLLNEICTVYLESINDKKGLLLAVIWGKHLMDFGESVDKYVLITKLCLKLKDYKQALEYAQKGIAFADILKLKSDNLNPLLEEAKKHNK